MGAANSTPSINSCTQYPFPVALSDHVLIRSPRLLCLLCKDVLGCLENVQLLEENCRRDDGVEGKQLSWGKVPAVLELLSPSRHEWQLRGNKSSDIPLHKNI
jgi:hypothetical protein